MQLVLSLFSGIGLLDKAFKEAGFCVVSAGDLIIGQDIRDFTGVKNKFAGVIGGSPCQDFSGLKRDKGDYSLEMVYEFLRVVGECEPDWYLLENVKGVPNVTELLQKCIVDDSYKHFKILNRDINVTELLQYSHQRIDINQGWYDETSRLRHIQFGSKDNLYLDIPRGKMNNIKNSCALASDDRSFRELCYIQGLDDNFDLPDFNVQGKKRAVGNGVPLSIGRVLANAVLAVSDPGYKSVTIKSSQGKINFIEFLNDNNTSFDSHMSSSFICSICNTQFNHTAHNKFDSKVYIFTLFEYLNFDYMDFLNNKNIKSKVTNFCNSIGVANTTFFLSICENCFNNHSFLSPVNNVTLQHDNSVTNRQDKNVNDREEKSVTERNKKRCACGCGRILTGRKKTYDSTCRKRLSRKKLTLGGIT